MRKKVLKTFCILCMALMMTMMTGCRSYKGNLKEGNICCKIALESIPKELVQMDEKFTGDIEILVSLDNPVTKMHYEICLNEGNEYMQDAYLNPGTYVVSYFYTTPVHYTIDVVANQSSILVGTGRDNYVGVHIDNVEELSQQLSEMVVSTEILSQDMFSRKVQWNGKIVDIESLKDSVDFDYSEKVGPYEEVTIESEREKIGLRVSNETGQQANWKDCKVKGVTFSGCNVVLPSGISIGMPYKDVVHSQDGIYGTPDMMTGSILLGFGIDALSACYNDADSGDMITVKSDDGGTFVKTIQYDFEVLE